ncbi:hypothetical protein [uncultured Aquimarina sp.]|uniref:hypothetical protein n=1 Tax=uncultured Aquimarina sp. TaxID=575652 RepID=UPI00261503F0|nr:hypothetical protein [uncultured Aquimarina sp.]
MKKINFIALLLLILTISCSNSQSTVKKNTSNVTNKQSIKVDWSKNTFLKPYKDSINVLTKTKVIPKFLKNECFDYDYDFYWEHKHNPKSFRKEIIFSVFDIEILEFLLKNKDKLSDEKCSQLLEHPYSGNPEKMDSQNSTNLELITIRLKQLSKG